MTHRERFYKSVLHEDPDRAVYDLCGCGQSIVLEEKTKNEMARLMGIEGEKQGFFNMDNRILEVLDIDTRLVGGEVTAPTGRARREGNIIYDDWGIGYCDDQMCYFPLQDCTIDEMMAYEFPDPDKIDRNLIDTWAKQAKYLHEETDYAVIAAHPIWGIFDAGCFLMSFEDFLYRLAGEPEFVHAFSERFFEYQKKVIDIYYGALGRYIDGTTGGEDYGTQRGPFMSKNMFDEQIKPYVKERITYTKKYTDAFYQHHTCGAVHDFIPSLIDCGVDILNPIQPGAYMMECERLKADFGDKITFWGGVDTQHLLPEGSVDEVKAEVKRILSVLDQNGGYILSPAHTVQGDVPAENIIAIFEGAKEYYR